MNIAHPRPVVLGDRPITTEELVAVARHGAAVEFSPLYVERVLRARRLVDRFVDEERVIYGVTTGFGDNYKKHIPTAQARQLQRNIVESHAVSVGAPLDEEVVRAIQVTMLSGLGSGHAGTSLETLELIRQLLNNRICPIAPGEGSVGYLSVEAHLARVLIGEGRATTASGIKSGADALQEFGLAPVVLGAKEGLTLTNGTHSVTAIAALVAHDAVRLARVADVISALSMEALRGTVNALDPRIHAMKAHPEQARVARNLSRLLEGSAIAERFRGYRVQDPYSLRAIPQIHGGAKRSIIDAVRVINEELESVGDNPVIIPEGDDGVALMGANFDSTFTGLAADSIVNALTVLAKISERRTDRMVNGAISELPPFLATDPGIDNGYMIAQYTSAALVMEMRSLASPASADSIPTSANQEDTVSNAYYATTKARSAVGKLEYILAIEAMCAVQALDLAAFAEHSSPALASLRHEVRAIVPPVTGDRYFGDDIENLTIAVRDGRMLSWVEDLVGPIDL